MAWVHNGEYSNEGAYRRYASYAATYANKAANELAKNSKRPYRVYWKPNSDAFHGRCYGFKTMTFTTAKEAIRKAGKVRIAGATDIAIRVWNTESKTWSTYYDR